MRVPFRLLETGSIDCAVELLIEDDVFVVRVSRNGVPLETKFKEEREAFAFFAVQAEQTSLPDIVTVTVH